MSKPVKTIHVKRKILEITHLPCRHIKNQLHSAISIAFPPPQDISNLEKFSVLTYQQHLSKMEMLSANINKRKTNPIEHKTRTKPKPKCAEKSEQQ
jgi:hypothetical protein